VKRKLYDRGVTGLDRLLFLLANTFERYTKKRLEKEARRAK
jgi:hypothetical protein